ncbi:MAG: lipocalin family protein [Lentisphaeria bacterium]|nr:lipocalin family protein [Lentisphaeria bacterium]
MNATPILLLAVLVLLLVCCRSVDSTADLAPVRGFSLGKYLGTWHEIVRLPHRFEKDLDNVKAEYSLQENGQVTVVNSGKKNGVEQTVKGYVKFKDADDIGELRVSFFRPFYGDYKIIYLEPDYSLAIVTSSTRKYLWVLSRRPSISDEKLAECLAKIRNWGFDVSRLQYPNRQ